jgi:hypothetical protein
MFQVILILLDGLSKKRLQGSLHFFVFSGTKGVAAAWTLGMDRWG